MALDITTLSVKVQAQGINDTAKALDNLALSAEKAEKSADRLGEKFSKSSTGILAIKSAMEGMKDMMSKAFPTEGAQALNRALGELSATLKTIKGKKIDIDIGSVGKDAEVARKGVESLNRSLMEGHNVFQVVGKSLYQLRNMLGGTMLFAALQNTTGAVISLADTWTLANARLKIFMGSADAAAVAQERLYNVSMDLKVPLQGVTTLFTRLVPAMAEYGYSTDSAMKVTTSMAAALKVSGATAAETSSVLLQFSQSMAAGRLNGAEFNAVAEGAPIVLRLLSKELGVSRAELKKMAADGLLSTATVADVLIDSLDELKNKAKDMPLTVSAALDMLSASFAKLFGEMNKGGGVTGIISASIELLAKNLSSIFNILGTVATAFVTYNALLAAYNIIVATSSTLSTSLAASLGITAAASGAAAGAVGLLNGALKLLMASPIILALTAIVTALFYFRDELFGTKDAAEKAGVAIQEALSKGDYQAAITAQQAEVARLSNEYNNLSGELVRLQKEQAKAKELGFATSSQEKVIQDLTVQVEKLKKQWEGAKDNLKEYNRELEGDKIKKATNAIDEYITKMQHEIGLKRKMSQADEMLWKAEKARSALGTDANIKRVREAEENINKAKQAIEVEKQHKEATKDRVKAIKESESALKRAMNAYARSVSSSEESIEKLKEELALKRNLTEAEKQVIKFRKDAEEFTKKTGRKSTELDENIKIIEQLGARKKFEDDLNKALDRKQARDLQVAETEAELANSIFMTNEAISKKVELVKRANAEIPTTPLQEQMDETTRIQERIGFLEAQIKITEELATTTAYLAYWSAYATGDEKAMERAEKAQDNIQKRIDGYNKEIATLKHVLDVSKDLAEQEFIRSKIRMQEIGRSPAQILADGFGEAGKAISTMITAYKDFGKESSAVNAELAGQLEFIQKNYQGEEAAKETVKASQAASDKQIQITSGMYASMAGSAKGFFSENSKGYKMMEKMEKAFRAIELAMAMKNFIQKMFFTQAETAAKVEGAVVGAAAEAAAGAANAASAAPAAIINAAQMPGPLAFAGAAAMIALIAGLGVAVSGGGGSTPNISEQRQSQQGTGTVFGDTGAKSESLTKALENISENSDISLQYNEGMLNALKNIEASIGGVTKQVIRQGVQGQVGFAAGMGTTTNSSMNEASGIGSKLGSMSMATLGIGSLINYVGKALFSVKKSVVDSGFIQNAQALSDIMKEGGGLNIMGYTDIETKKKKFGRTKTSTETNLSGLSEELQNQFSNIIIGMGTAVKEAAGVLKMDGEGFTETLNSFVVDIGRISIQGMNAEQIQETLTNVFSKVGDEMAASVFPGLIEFQNVGEGMLETLIRVSSTVATVDGIFNQIGQSIGGVGLEGAAAKLKLIDLAGGLQELSNLTQGFYDNFYTETEKTANKTRLVTEEFKRLGVEMIDLKNPDARINFRTLVESLKDTNQEAYVGLLKLQESVSDLIPEFKAAETAIDLTNQKLSLQDKINQMTMTSSQYIALQRQRELDAMDESLHPLQLRIYALEDENTASQKSLELSKKRQDIELKILSLTNPIAYTVALRQKELASLDESLKPLQERVWALEDEKAATDSLITATDSLINSLTQSLNTMDGLIGSVDSLSETGRGLVGLSPKTKTLVESFNDTEAQINSLSETLNTFSGTAVLSVTESLAALIEQSNGMSDFQNSLTDSIASLRFESMSLEDRLSSLKAKESKLFREITSSKDPLKLAKDLQDTINTRYSLEKEYQDRLISGQQEINNTSKDTIKQQIDALKNTRDLLGEIRSFTYDLRIGDSSVLSPQKQLEVASQQFYEVLAKAKEGDTKAQSSITSVAKTFLDEAKGYYASTTGYVDIFNQVMGALSGFGTTEVIDPQLVMLEKQLTALDSLNISTIDLREQQAIDLEKVGTTLSGLQEENRAKQEELVQTLKDQIAELKEVQSNQVAQIKQQLAIRDETNALLNDAKTKLTDMRDSLKLLERK